MTALRDIAGHEMIKQSLHNALALDRVAHAYLFGGPPGVGKKTTAQAFAAALLCRQGAGDACGECGDCWRVQRGVHPDLQLIRPDGSSIKINQLRAVQESAAFSSFSGGRRVYLVEQAEKMTLEAANCFLRILEEPPGRVVFILVSDDPGGMLPTVLSRCHVYRFNPLARDEVLRVLAARLNAGGERAGVAASLSGGSPGRAMELLETGDRRAELLDMLLRLVRERPGGFCWPPDSLSDRSGVEEWAGFLTVFFRDVMVWQQTGAADLLVNADYQEQIAELAGAFSQREVLDILITAEKAARQLANNANQRLVLDALFFKIAGIRDV